MTVTINGKSITMTSPPKKSSTHTKARPYRGSLSEPGRFRISNWMYILNMSHSAFYERLKRPYKYKHPVPSPDGKDPRPYWNTETVRAFLEK